MHVFSLKTIRLLILSTLTIVLVQCRQSDQGKHPKDPADYRESLLKANREAVKKENEQIEDYIQRHNLEMEKTNTGIRITITKPGIGPGTQVGMTVKLSYTMTLLTGDTVYSALKEGPMIFEVGKGQVITGLEEAILLLRVGDHAKIIIPSHLAFGLIGDQKKILHKATLVYDMEFISMY